MTEDTPSENQVLTEEELRLSIMKNFEETLNERGVKELFDEIWYVIHSFKHGSHSSKRLDIYINDELEKRKQNRIDRRKANDE